MDKKDYPSRTFRFPPELLERLGKYCEKTGISRTFVVGKAVGKYLDEVEGVGAGLWEDKEDGGS